MWTRAQVCRATPQKPRAVSAQAHPALRWDSTEGSPAAGVPSSQLQGYGAWQEGEPLGPGSAFRELCSKVWVSPVVAWNGSEEEVPPIPISLLSKLLPLKNSLHTVDTHYDIDELKQQKTDCSISTSFPSETPKERKGWKDFVGQGS